MKVLIVEDDLTLAENLAKVLAENSMIAEITVDGDEAEYLGETGVFDAAVLDLGLPKKDGITVLRHWRGKGVTMPVLILTARGRWADKREGFNAGADDYLTKPFYAEEAVVRLQALMRRAAGYATPLLKCGVLALDTAKTQFFVNNDPIVLTAQEYRMLEYLLHRKGRIVSRLELADHVYGNDQDPDSNVVDVLISRIRKKIGSDMIVTVRGLGYKLIEGG